MTFKEWKDWFRELPWSVRWFVVLVLLRPLIDNFYKLKEVSPLLSPLYIVGVLTPVLIVFSIASKKFSRRNKSQVSNYLLAFGFFVVFNWILLDILFPKLNILALSIKAMSPFFLFIYLLYIVRSIRDLHGILTSFLYSGIYLLIMILYEMIFGGLSEAYVSEGRGGGERFIGVYNDMMNYAIYIVGALLIGGYFFLRNVYSGNKSGFGVLKFVSILVLCIIGLIGIKHVSTWAVCLAIFTFFALSNLRNFKGFFIILFLTSIFAVFFGESIYDNQIKPLIEKEINVASGDAIIEGGLNGRIGRWERYFDIWFDDVPIYGKLFGVPLSGVPTSVVMCGGGMHNDYVRNLFTAGIVGLFFYFIFLFLVLYRARSFKTPEKFLIVGALIALMLHSISTLPLDYSSYIYLLFPIISFSLLPLKEAYRLDQPSYSKNGIRKNISARPRFVGSGTMA